MPRLPIPPLEQTTRKYLKTLEPLLSVEDLAKSRKFVEDFTKPGGLGETLQGRLVAYEKEQKNSWLEDIWLKKAYLEWRESSMINVNWWSQFVDHPQQPKDLLRKPPPKGVFSTFQVTRAAGLISNLLNAKEILDSETLPTEYIKDNPLCMNQYKCQFGSTRIPSSPSDIGSTIHPALGKHITVMAKDQIYKVPVMQEDGARVTLLELERLLYECTLNANNGSPDASVGILTAGHRDTWSTAFKDLMEDQGNRESFEAIKDSLFVVCLDNHSAHKNFDISHHQFFHNFDGTNRWFDKAIQIIVTNSGRAGINGEHSPADAVIPARMVDYILQNEPAHDPLDATAVELASPLKLKWNVSPAVENLIAEASAQAKELASDVESVVFHTDIYGARYMKEVAQCSPDAFVQMLLQVVWKRLHNEPTAVYESASTRLFLHGRTETCRSLSNESLSFFESFDDPDVLFSERTERFRKAVTAHLNYIKACSVGQGIDRHFIGLRSMLQGTEAEEAKIFTDAAFWKSMTFKLSSSNVSPGTYHWGGFGPVVKDGYGVNYAIAKDSLKFSISSWKSASATNSFKFRDVLERSLKDMMLLFPPRSEAWGPQWQAKHELESKEAHVMKKMKELSDANAAELRIKWNHLIKDE